MSTDNRPAEHAEDTESKMPRTDAIWAMVKKAACDLDGYEHRKAASEAARIGIEDLETELNAAKEREATLNSCCDGYIQQVDELRARLAEAEKGKAKLVALVAEVLNSHKIIEPGWGDVLRDLRKAIDSASSVSSVGKATAD